MLKRRLDKLEARHGHKIDTPTLIFIAGVRDEATPADTCGALFMGGSALIRDAGESEADFINRANAHADEIKRAKLRGRL